MPTLKKLDLFWKQARVPSKWKIQVFNAVCVTKLLYSLEALQPTQAAASKLDTFQLKGLRKILNMSTTYIDRANTNEEVFRRANAAISEGHHRYIRPLSEVLKKNVENYWAISSDDLMTTHNTKPHVLQEHLYQERRKGVGLVGPEQHGHMKP